MGRIVLYIAVSLDGYIARPDGAVDWLDPFNDQGTDYGYAEFVRGVGASIMGRRTWEHSMAYGGTGAPGKPSFVLTRQGPGPVTQQPVHYVNLPVPELASQARASAGASDVWLIGGGDVARQFSAAGQIDLYRIFVIPVLLGNGLPLWPGSGPEQALRLLHSESWHTGVTELRYQPA
ncbi:dihydrofolate reductase [bacterium]|nr:dihydrofolate reductase [bacterium]